MSNLSSLILVLNSNVALGELLCLLRQLFIDFLVSSSVHQETWRQQLCCDCGSRLSVCIVVLMLSKSMPMLTGDYSRNVSLFWLEVLRRAEKDEITALS